MRALIIFIFFFFLSGCVERNGSTITKKDKLLDGEWMLVSIDEKYPFIRNGLKFSEDNQVFHIDTQGHTVPAHNIEIYKVYGDTLEIIDYKYEPQFIQEKGTHIFLIKELNQDELVLECIYPSPNRITFRKQ
ncbi:MAG: hypothetical protein WC994_02115 [Brumimicrobium sp.]